MKAFNPIAFKAGYLKFYLIYHFSELLENSKLEIQMLQDVNRSLKEFLIYGLNSEDNLASLNSHFDEITKILIQSAESETRNGSDEPEKESKEEILARILNLEIEIDKIHKLNEQSVNQSNINEVIDQMNDLNSQVSSSSNYRNNNHRLNVPCD